MKELQVLPNVGNVLAEHLQAIGICSPASLKASTAEKVFMQIRIQRDSGACLSMLYGLEGAIQGIPKGQISAERKQELRQFYQNLS